MTDFKKYDDVLIKKINAQVKLLARIAKSKKLKAKEIDFPEVFPL